MTMMLWQLMTLMMLGSLMMSEPGHKLRPEPSLLFPLSYEEKMDPSEATTYKRLGLWLFNFLAFLHTSFTTQHKELHS